MTRPGPACPCTTQPTMHDMCDASVDSHEHHHTHKTLPSQGLLAAAAQMQAPPVATTCMVGRTCMSGAIQHTARPCKTDTEVAGTRRAHRHAKELWQRRGCRHARRQHGVYTRVRPRQARLPARFAVCRVHRRRPGSRATALVVDSRASVQVRQHSDQPGVALTGTRVHNVHSAHCNIRQRMLHFRG